MTIFVDNVHIPARVGRHTSTWCHLVTDSPDLEELHRFAESIGLRRSYFQDKRHGPGDKGRPHYDVTAGKRAQAVAAGATEVDVRDLVDINARRCRAAEIESPTLFDDPTQVG